MRKPFKNAFTLVELLVVIGIMALLISILLPALSKARETALRVKCGSNFHACGVAILNYASDNKGWVYPAYDLWGAQGCESDLWWGDQDLFLVRTEPGGGTHQ